MDWQRNGFAALGLPFTELRPTPCPPVWVGTSEWPQRCFGLPGRLAAARRRPAGLHRQRPARQPAAGQRVQRPPVRRLGRAAGRRRAILLGETPGGQEVQLRAAGARRIRAWATGAPCCVSSIREFLCSEAHGAALGIPTTRALCVTGRPSQWRARSWRPPPWSRAWRRASIRFGHFRHFAARGQEATELRQLADYVIGVTTPNAAGRQSLRPAAATWSERTAALLAQWRPWFCHGVMNTDNMSILGLTIDYGPFQFLDAFDPGHICNHSDHLGHYAFNRQPGVAYWNLLCLAVALLPLIRDVEQAQ